MTLHLKPIVAAYRARRDAWERDFPVPLGEDRSYRPGDLRAATGEDGTRRVVILVAPITIRGEAAWQVRLVHTYPEMATEDDRVYGAQVAAWWPIVVNRSRFVMWEREIDDERVGWLDPAAEGRPGVHPRGFLLTGPLDARWGFRQGEIDTTLRLQQSAVRAALEQSE